MAASIQVKRGTTAKVAAYTPLSGELVLDTTTNKLIAGDGSTAGGKPLKFDLTAMGFLYSNPMFTVPTDSGTIKVQCQSSVITTDASGNATITYPSAFKQGVLTVLAMNGDYSNGGDVVVSLRNWDAAKLTTFDVHLSGSVSGTRRVNYIAIGI